MQLYIASPRHLKELIDQIQPQQDKKDNIHGQERGLGEPVHALECRGAYRLDQVVIEYEEYDELPE